MEWLKELLEKAQITDGKLNVDEVMEVAKKEFPKHAVPKNVFNDKCEELKTANATITTLKKENGDNEELQNKIMIMKQKSEILRLLRLMQQNSMH